jgi:hypothetical protein
MALSDKGRAGFLLTAVLIVFTAAGYAQNWICETSSADWLTRKALSSVSFQDKLWVFNGYHSLNVKRHDIWWSTDGNSWTCANSDVPYPMSSNMNCVVFNEKIWLYTGRDGC